MSYALPNTMHYQSRVESSASRSYRSNIQPQGATSYGIGDTLLFNIPTRPNLTLAQSESYVKFTVKVPTVAALAALSANFPPCCTPFSNILLPMPTTVAVFSVD